MMMRIACTAALAAAVGLCAADARAAATITIVNGNAPGVGFNDPAPRAPIGGNTGTTLGQQRLIAFQQAAQRWGATLDSPVPIRILATFEAQVCTATSATLGSAGTRFIYANFPSVGLYPGPVLPSTWHGGALADKRAGFELDPVEDDGVTPRADIRARFNSLLNGNPACLGGRQWYLGLDANHGNDIDLMAVLLHEFSHGLGFQQFASVTTGQQIPEVDGGPGLPDVFNVHIFDNTTGKYWYQMTDAERKASAINPSRVAFDGPTVNAAAAVVLAGTPALFIGSPAAIAGTYVVGTASFGAKITATGVAGSIVRALDAANAAGPTTGDACTAITNAAAVSGGIALVDRGTCGFVVKAKNVQDAGAIGMIVADNAAGPVTGMSGFDLSVTIPAVRITLAVGNTIKTQLASTTVTGRIATDPAVPAGTDASHRPLLYTPAAVAAGSTISHYDTAAYPNQLMEPFINDDLTHSVKPPEDLTLPLLRDIGWFADGDLDGLADSADACPASNRSATVVVDGENTGVANVLFTSGCTIADLVAQISASAKNHGGFVSEITHLLNALRDAGIIGQDERGRIHSAAAHASHP
jgi:hypothetical protein